MPGQLEQSKEHGYKKGELLEDSMRKLCRSAEDKGRVEQRFSEGGREERETLETPNVLQPLCGEANSRHWDIVAMNVFDVEAFPLSIAPETPLHDLLSHACLTFTDCFLSPSCLCMQAHTLSFTWPVIFDYYMGLFICDNTAYHPTSNTSLSPQAD